MAGSGETVNLNVLIAERLYPLKVTKSQEEKLQRAVELIEVGRRRPLDLIEVVHTRWASFSELEHLEHSENFFLNINTPEDYYDASRRGTTDGDSTDGS